MDSEIESILQDADWWMDTLGETRDIDTMNEFMKFSYKFMPAMIAEIKMMNKFIELNHLDKLYRIYKEQKSEAEQDG